MICGVFTLCGRRGGPCATVRRRVHREGLKDQLPACLPQAIGTSSCGCQEAIWVVIRHHSQPGFDLRLGSARLESAELSVNVMMKIYPVAVLFAFVPSEKDIKAGHEKAKMGARSDSVDTQTEKQVLLAVLCSFALQRFRDLHLSTAASCISCTTFRTPVFLLCRNKTLKGLAVI